MPRGPTLIPKVIHRIWFGPPMPDHLATYGDTWAALHPGWEHRLWTEANLPELRNQHLFDRAEKIAPRNVGQFRADVARYEILATVGGVYVDADFECQRPLDPLLDGVDCFAAWEVTGRWVNNAIFGATPGHPFVEELIVGLPASVAAHPGARPNRISGPQYVTPIYRRHTDRVTVFPKRWFYPFLHNELDRRDDEFPDAYAVHRWHNRMTERGLS